MNGRMFALVVLLLPGGVLAAGIDCTKAVGPIEAFVCSQESLLTQDAAMTAAFDQALRDTTDKAALQLDQQHWLAARDDGAWVQMHVGVKGAALRFLEGAYAERTDFLRHLGETALAPLGGLQTALPTLPGQSRDVIRALAARDDGIAMGTEVTMASVDAADFPTDAVLRNKLAKMDGFGRHRRVLTGSSLGSLFSVAGTADCLYELPFRIDGGRALDAPTPEIWGNGDCWTVDHELANIHGTATALRIDTTVADQVLLLASPWTGSGFGPTSNLLVRFDRTLAVKESACANDEHPCADFAALALDLARRHDARPLPGTLDTPLTGAQAASWEVLREVSQAPPNFERGSESYTRMSSMGVDAGRWDLPGFDKDAVFFPVVFRGEVLLGRIGHGHVGWRTSPSWNVAAWRLRDGLLEPVGSASIEVSQGRVLLAAPLSSVKLPTRWIGWNGG